MLVRPFCAADQAQVVELWHRCGLLRAANDPHKDIARKVAHSPELFLVGATGPDVMATAMVGYEGHRGWINYLAVTPERQRTGLGAQIMAAAETLLRSLGCAKINLQIRATNRDALIFYREIGFSEDAVVSMGKRLAHD